MWWRSAAEGEKGVEGERRRLPGLAPRGESSSTATRGLDKSRLLETSSSFEILIFKVVAKGSTSPII
jgi:hypothetical protein